MGYIESHLTQGAERHIISDVGAEAFDGVRIGVVQHVGIVPFGGVVYRLVVGGYAVLENGRAHEEAVLGIETIVDEFVYCSDTAVVGLAEHSCVGIDDPVVVGGHQPNDLVPILVADANAVFGDAPEGFLGSLRA